MIFFLKNDPKPPKSSCYSTFPPAYIISTDMSICSQELNIVVLELGFITCAYGNSERKISLSTCYKSQFQDNYI